MSKKTIPVLMLSISVFLCALYFSYPPAAFADTDLHGRIVILDPGHGFDYTNTYKDYDEQVTMLSLALKIKPLLEARGAIVYMTRPTQIEVPLPVRAAMINRWALQTVKAAMQDEGGDLREINRLLRVMQSVIDDPETNAPIYLNSPFDYSYTREIHPDLRRIFEYENDPVIRDRFLVISLHSNATSKPINELRSGVEMYYISNSREHDQNYYTNYSYEDLDLNFANLLMDKMSRIGMEKAFIEPSNYLIIREHNVPCVLVENGFHTNDRERAMLMDDAFLDRLAQVYADAITDYYGKLGSLIKLYYPEPLDDVFG